MRQVLPRALFLLRRPPVLIAVLAVAVGGSALVALPLFGIPGYELGMAVAAGVGVLGGIIGGASAFQERRLIQGRDPRPKNAERRDSALASAWLAVASALTINLAVIVPPFIVAVVFALTSSRCDPFAQVGFYPLLTIPSAVIASAAGVLCGFLARRFWATGLLYLALLLISGALTGFPIYFGPQVFAFNHFVGYFPGPLYDEALKVHPALVWFRLETLLVAGFLWLFTALFLDMREGRISRPHFRPGSFALLALIAVSIAALEGRAPALGTRMTPAFLAAKLGGTRETDHFQIIYWRGKPKEEVDRLAREVEFRRQQVLAFLGKAPEGKISVYVYRSPEEKAALVGAANTQFAKPWRLELHVNDGPFPLPALKHELTHVMAAPLGTGPFQITSRFGVWPNMGVVEGTAVAGDNPVTELTLHEWAAAMRKEKLAPDLDRLFNPRGFYGSAAPRAYTYAGSFIRYLADTYGQAKFQALYAHGDFQGAYGRTLDGLREEWEKFLDGIPLSEAARAEAFARFRQGSLFSRPCAREVAQLKTDAEETLPSDPARALRLFERCEEIQPEEPGFVLGAASALDALDRRDDAWTRLAQLAKRVKDQPALLADVLLQQADVAVKLGKKDEAERELKEILTLNVGGALDRTARVKLAALFSPVVGPAIWDYFKPGHDEVRLLRLRDALELDPHNPILNYLIGRRLAQGGAPDLASAYLGRALGGELAPTIRKEAWRLKMESDFTAGDCNGVRDDVGHLPDLGAALKATAHEWVERCDFEQHFR